MKKVKRRTYFVIVFVALILLGLIYFLFRLAVNGQSWVTFPSNKNVFSGGVLALGTVYDRDGTLLADAGPDGIIYSDSESVRRSSLHVVGDTYSNIATGALKAFSNELIGYNMINGTYSANGAGRDLYLTIDSDLNTVAYNALNGRKGTVAVYNYLTGEIICNVSTPTYDPQSPPEISDGDPNYEGVYMNRFLSSTFTPGSTYKIITTAAAIDTLPDAYDRQYTCTGSVTINGTAINCTGTHGAIALDEAFAVSCNVYFAELSLALGSDTMAKYSEKLGITSSTQVDGIKTATGKFTAAADGTAELAWSGIGQYENLANPCAMLTLMGAIANGGEPVMPRLISKVSGTLGITHTAKTGARLLSTDTAAALKSLMRNNVVSHYGDSRFPNLSLCAKTGTAEVGGDASPHSWFVGFLNDDNHPLAFVVVVENGGSGLSGAGGVANTVLQAAVSVD